MFTFDLEGSGSSQSQRECAGINRSEWCVCVCDIQVGHRCGSRNTPVGQEADLEVYLRISGEGVC